VTSSATNGLKGATQGEGTFRRDAERDPRDAGATRKGCVSWSVAVCRIRLRWEATVICGGSLRTATRPPLHQKEGIGLPKAGIFPAISAFSAFDRLWGIFFYFRNWSGIASGCGGFLGLRLGALPKLSHFGPSALAEAARWDSAPYHTNLWLKNCWWIITDQTRNNNISTYQDTLIFVLASPPPRGIFATNEPG
jgi:hypothetical protein